MSETDLIHVLRGNGAEYKSALYTSADLKTYHSGLNSHRNREPDSNLIQMEPDVSGDLPGAEVTNRSNMVLHLLWLHWFVQVTSSRCGTSITLHLYPCTDSSLKCDAASLSMAFPFEH